MKKSTSCVKNKVICKPLGASKNMPVISRWRRNFINSLTSAIWNSKPFLDGEVISTSPLEKGVIVKRGTVVSTESGSKYFFLNYVTLAHVFRTTLGDYVEIVRFIHFSLHSEVRGESMICIYT